MLKIAVIDNSIFDTNRIIQILKQIQSNAEIESYNSITNVPATIKTNPANAFLESFSLNTT